MQNAPVTKDLVIRLRAEQVDRDRLDALARHYEMSDAQIVRMLIKRDFETLKLVPAKKGKGK